MANVKPALKAAAAAASTPPAVIDLDAARAQRAEARGNKSQAVKLGGDEFTFPTANEWPAEIPTLLRDGDFVGAISLMLPEADRERFFSHRPTMGDIEALFEALSKASGVGGLGNS